MGNLVAEVHASDDEMVPSWTRVAAVEMETNGWIQGKDDRS